MVYFVHRFNTTAMTGNRPTDLNPPAASPISWANLPDALLLSVLDRLRCLRDLLAVTVVCRSWRVVACSVLLSPSVDRPPLLLWPVVPDEGQYDRGFGRSRWSYASPCKLKLISPVGPSASTRAMVAPGTLRRYFLGSAYGQLIFCDDQDVIIVDIFTGVELRLSFSHIDPWCSSYATLTGPLTHPGSSVLLCFREYIFRLPVDDSAGGVCMCGRYDFPILHILAFQDEIFGLGSKGSLYAIELSPCFRVKQLASKVPAEMSVTSTYTRFLVECGGELMQLRIAQGGKVTLYRLSLSGQLEWVKVDSLGDWALFIDEVARTTASCANPIRWGGRNNCIYYAGRRSVKWTEFLLDETAYFLGRDMVRWPYPTWVYPSMIYGPQ